MSELPEPAAPLTGNPLQRGVENVGGAVRGTLVGMRDGVEYTGGVIRMLGIVIGRGVAGLLGRGIGGRVRLEPIFRQCVRVGVKSLPIIILVQVFIGVILSLNMAPTLQVYGQLERTADIVAIAVFRELGPLISAVLLSGYAGAAIAAEIGAMVEGEEIKALKAHALDPIRFLVVPRVFATTIMMFMLTIVADVVGVLGGMITGVYVLGISATTYLDQTRLAVQTDDYFTGLAKSLVFGAIIALLACYEGLNVRGGAEGVGAATTTTVVKSIVSLILADMIFTAVFYVMGW